MFHDRVTGRLDFEFRALLVVEWYLIRGGGDHDPNDHIHMNEVLDPMPSSSPHRQDLIEKTGVVFMDSHATGTILHASPLPYLPRFGRSEWIAQDYRNLSRLVRTCTCGLPHEHFVIRMLTHPRSKASLLRYGS